MQNGFVNGVLLDGRFEAIAPLNHGSFGMVFLAKDTTSGEMVAIKCLLKSTSASGSTEMQVSDHLVELNCHDRLGYHPNIVNLLHYFETEAHMYLVLEYCSMGDLYEAIRLGRGPLETQHVREFMLQLVSAVEHMHSKNLYHRDIKPENIFLAQDGSLKLGDFGLSTTESWTYESSVGSDRYMAPEQYDPSDSGYSPAHADIWAIGICLLNILFSRNPFVTPSESDVLFADFVRDRQSLFDVFPSMSQDTFEVLIHALAIDPSKRSLSGVREALERAVSFTTDDDLFDDFCTEDRSAVSATANRQPLRTPSIQSPPIEQGGAFPWAKALHMSPQQNARQLSVIHDAEFDSDDLFPEKTPGAWYTPVPAPETPSLASVIDSALGASIQSMTLREPKPRNALTRTVTAISGSLPVTSSKPISTASIFGNDNFSKSWSDLWDEEEEEEADARRLYNQRNWSTDSIDEDVTIRRTGLSELKDVNSRTQSPLVTDIIVSQDGSSEPVENIDDASLSARKSCVYSPPAKRSVLDKWADLGNRRRAITSDNEDNHDEEGSRKRANTGVSTWRRGFGIGSIKAFSGNTKPTTATTTTSKERTTKAEHSREGRKSRDRGSGRDRGMSWGDALRITDWRKDAGPLHDDVAIVSPTTDDGSHDAEWVGGWRDLHL
jgi:serine/threonine protein kinase